MPVQKKEQKKVKKGKSKRSKEKIKSNLKVSKGMGYFWLKLTGLFKGKRKRRGNKK